VSGALADGAATANSSERRIRHIPFRELCKSTRAHACGIEVLSCVRRADRKKRHVASGVMSDGPGSLARPAFCPQGLRKRRIFDRSLATGPLTPRAFGSAVASDLLRLNEPGHRNHINGDHDTQRCQRDSTGCSERWRRGT
jgi:hypothetical protein